MQDRLKEIEGTLARTKERKNTILYKLSKRKQEEERLALLGVQKLPTNPHEVEDVKVIKHVLYRLKQEIGDKTAHLRDEKLLSIDKDGEAVVRARNDEVNKLLARKTQWEARLAHLSGEVVPRRSRKRLFFGCAKELPEAIETQKRSRTDDIVEAGLSTPPVDTDSDESRVSEVEETEQIHAGDTDYQEKIRWLGSGLADKELVQVERTAEARIRAKAEPSILKTYPSSFVLSYIKDGKLDIPSEEHFKRQLLDSRKKVLQERLCAMRKRE